MKELYICSQATVDLLKPKNVSKGVDIYIFDPNIREKVYIAEIDYYKALEVYNNVKSENDIDFWLHELVPGTMSIDYLEKDDFKDNDPFTAIELATGLTKFNNVAMVIRNFCDRECLDPIDFWNSLKFEKYY